MEYLFVDVYLTQDPVYGISYLPCALLNEKLLVIVSMNCFFSSGIQFSSNCSLYLDYVVWLMFQGRMVGNPYSSLDPGLGPLMRDVKNKICQDCELVALLEDDNGMELLICNKIISLDLPVKEV